MKTTSALLASVVLTAVLGCSGKPTPPSSGQTDQGPAPDRDAPAPILGAWELVSAECDGMPVDVGWKKVTVEERKFTYDDTPTGPQQRPASLTRKQGGGEYTLQAPDQCGIYKIEGDKLYMSEGKAGAKAPTDFASKPGTDHFYLVLKRVKD